MPTLVRVFKFSKMKTRVKKVTVNPNTILQDALTLYKGASDDIIGRPMEIEFVESEVVDLGGPWRQFFNTVLMASRKAIYCSFLKEMVVFCHP